MRLRLPRSTRARLVLGAGLLVLIAAVAVGAIAYEHDRTGSIYHPHARFIPQPAPRPKNVAVSRFVWPFYGYTPSHTRFFPAPAGLRPPFETVWQQDRHTLLEFPPVIARERLFQLADDGVIFATATRTGETVWKRRLGVLSASAPAVVGGRVYATVLDRTGSAHSGRVYALDAATGAVLWQRDLNSPSESSPLVDDGRVFFGSQSGTVYALDASNGHVIWTYHAAGAVKASPSLSGGILYFGDYSGQVQAISEQSGRRIWRSGSSGSVFGSGNFYSTAAVIYGRVFLGNTDGRVYAYDASSGRLDWAVQTGAYVYSSPAVTDAPGIGPTVYVGSYDGTFRAIDARSGHVSWTFNAHGRISGSATIIGDIVYFSDLATHRTYGLGISTGRVAFKAHTGAFDPVVADDSDMFLTGVSGLYELAPVSSPAHSAPQARAHAKAKSGPRRSRGRASARTRASSRRARRQHTRRHS
jgi:outer membrane protein assembly factor BamB